MTVTIYACPSASWAKRRGETTAEQKKLEKASKTVNELAKLLVRAAQDTNDLIVAGVLVEKLACLPAGMLLDRFYLSRAGQDRERRRPGGWNGGEAPVQNDRDAEQAQGNGDSGVRLWGVYIGCGVYVGACLRCMSTAPVGIFGHPRSPCCVGAHPEHRVAAREGEEDTS